MAESGWVEEQIARFVVKALKDDRRGSCLHSDKCDREIQSPAGARRSGFDFPIIDKERAWDVIDVLRPIAEAHGVSPARIALAWILSRPTVTSVIIGAERLDQLWDNLAAVDRILSEDELARLDAVSALPPESPGWIIAVHGADRLGPVDLWKGATSALGQRKTHAGGLLHSL